MQRLPFVLLLAACHRNDDAHLVDNLERIDGLTVVPASSGNPDYQRFELFFTMPVDHDDPDGETFEQWATLMHRSVDAPMVLVSTGYWNYLDGSLAEPTVMLDANQLIVEHRYFGSSIPEDPDWTFMNIEQAANDHHVIREDLADIYEGSWISTGASKGGMTSVFHRRFFPDDVDGMIPYVAPLSHAVPDPAYASFVDEIGEPDCREAIRELQVEMLSNRRAMLEARTQQQSDEVGWLYSRVAVGPAVENAIVELNWSFWQYQGVAACDRVPAVDADDDAVWEFLDQVSPAIALSDQYCEAFGPYYFQSRWELGYPDVDVGYLEAHLQYEDADYEGLYPPGVTIPDFDPAPMEEVAAFLDSDAAHTVLVYGEWDPWTAGAMQLGSSEDAASYLVAQGTHGSKIGDLAPADRDAATAQIERWTGMPATGDASRQTRVAEPRPARLRR